MHADSAQKNAASIHDAYTGMCPNRLQVLARAHHQQCRLFSVPRNITMICEHEPGTQVVSATAKTKLTFSSLVGCCMCITSALTC